MTRIIGALLVIGWLVSAWVNGSLDILIVRGLLSGLVYYVMMCTWDKQLAHASERRVDDATITIEGHKDNLERKGKKNGPPTMTPVQRAEARRAIRAEERELEKAKDLVAKWHSLVVLSSLLLGWGTFFYPPVLWSVIGYLVSRAPVVHKAHRWVFVTLGLLLTVGFPILLAGVYLLVFGLYVGLTQIGAIPSLGHCWTQRAARLEAQASFYSNP